MKKIITIFSIVFLFSLTFTPAFADGNDSVYNKNSAEVHNGFMVMSNTGSNEALGSYGGRGGDGGDIRNGLSHYYGPVMIANDMEKGHGGPSMPDGDVEDSVTGNGGAGGDAAAGGTVVTGNAVVTMGVENWVNRNETDINRCGDCDNNDDGDILVKSRNRAIVANEGGAAANTGENLADGSYAGSGGDGGVIENASDGDVEDSTTGSGANGGAGSLGGLVQTGVSDVLASLVNRINENVTRIVR